MKSTVSSVMLVPPRWPANCVEPRHTRVAERARQAGALITAAGVAEIEQFLADDAQHEAMRIA